MRAVFFRFVACLMVAGWNANAATVSSLEVAPTTLELKAGQPGLLYIANHSGVPLTVQIDAYDWKQSGNADHLSLSDTAFVSPPLATIAPGERQIVRVLAERGAVSKEAAYRVRVSELPDPSVKSTGVQVLLQFSIPVFVRGNTPSPEAVVWAAASDGATLKLTAWNKGGRTLKLAGLKIAPSGGAPIAVASGADYVLPDAMHVWTLDAASLSSAGRIHVAAADERSGRPVAVDLDIAR